LAKQELPDLPEQHLFGEAKSCNTAPCIALATAICERIWGSEGVMVILSADHYLGDEAGYRQALQVAIQTAAEQDCLVTLGVPPTRPETGYGYLECDCPTEKIPTGETAGLVAFKEKPNPAQALDYLQDGYHLWNKGDFIWRVGVVAAEFEKSMPELFSLARATVSTLGGGTHSVRPSELDSFFLNLPDEYCQSIDFGIMEKADAIRVVPCRVPWDDVGSWAVLRRLRGNELDSEGNLSLIHHLAIDTRNTVVTGSESTAGIVVTLGVEGLIIVRDGERLLVASEPGLEKMRDVVRRLKEAGLEHLL
jgi:mannose-1-phosphate guanylyltransferase